MWKHITLAIKTNIKLICTYLYFQGYENNDIHIVHGEDISEEAMIKLLLFAIPSMAGIVLQLTGYSFSEASILDPINPKLELSFEYMLTTY